MDHGTISPLSATVLGVLIEGGQKETITIQTSRGASSSGRLSLRMGNKGQEVALSLDAIKWCLTNMLVAVDRDTPQMKGGMKLPLICTTQE